MTQNTWVKWGDLAEPDREKARSNPVIRDRVGLPEYQNNIFSGLKLESRTESEMAALWDRLVDDYPEMIETAPIEFTTGE